ncbi:MAG: hypothetical protein LC754_16870 [Acidobacteria bacterium]|nr:hypothetical protein [Acidobacteriota bacterium]
MIKRAACILALLYLIGTVSAFGQQPAGQNVQRLSIPGKDWALEISLPKFVLKQDQLRNDKKGRMILAGIEDAGYIVSIYLEPVPQKESSRDLRDSIAENLKAQSEIKKDDFKTSEYKQMPTLEYLVKEFKGQHVNQKHLNAYIVKDDIWIDIHFSKLLFKPGDEQLFYQILDSVKFIVNDKPAAAGPTSLDYLQQGSSYYLKGDYKKAVAPYSKALELEKQKPQLGKTLWRVLIDNLGMSYGITGDLKSAKETFEYGLSKDATYPLFHYNMACTYAEMNDLDAAIASLKQAFAHKDNIISGEQMPDPASDDSFKRFKKNEKFRQALKELNQ